MLKKTQRLKKSYQIEQLFRKGNTIKSTHLLCKHLPSLAPHNRVVVTVAKKLKLKAFCRNRLKRQILDAYKRDFQLSNNNKFDLIFILTKIPDRTVARFQTFQEEIRSISLKIK